MTTTTIQRYSEKFPVEIRKAIEGLDGDTEQAVFILLFNEDELAFTELQEELGDQEPLHPTTLSTALENLKEGGLIRKRITDAPEEDPFSSYYSISEYGDRFLNSLFDSLGIADGPIGRRQTIIGGTGSDLVESGEEFRDQLKMAF